MRKQRNESVEEKKIRIMSNAVEFAKEYGYGYDVYENKYKILELFKYQKKMLIDLEKNKFAIIKQSRQVGIDSILAIYISYFILKNKDKRVVIMSNNLVCSKNFLDKIRNILFKSKAIIAINNEKNIMLDNGSDVKVISSSIDAIMGYSFDFIYINNFEFIKGVDNIYTSLFQHLKDESSKCIISSTPQYKKDLFHKLWTSAVKKETDSFLPMNIIWNKNPNFNEEWYQKKCKELNYSKDLISTELDAKFLSKTEKIKKASINIRLTKNKKDKILFKMREKNMSSITEYIMELIDEDLKS